MRYKDSSKSFAMAAGSCFPLPLLFRKKTFGFEKGKDCLGAAKKSGASEKARDTRNMVARKSSAVEGNKVARKSSEVEGNKVARKSTEVAGNTVARRSSEVAGNTVARRSSEVAGNMVARKSSGVADNFVTMTDLRKKIKAFRDLLDLPPCLGSSSIIELVIDTVKELNKLHPDIVQCISVSKAEGTPMHQVINSFCETLKSLGNHWVRNDEWMVKSKDAKIANSELEERAHAVLDDMINVVRERIFDMMDMDDEEPVNSSASSSPPIGSFRKSFPESYSDKPSLSSSPNTPTSVLPQFLSSRSSKERSKVSCSPPLLLPLRVQAVEKLNAIDIKRLSFHMYPHAAQQLQLKNREEATRDSEVTADDVMQVDSDGVNGDGNSDKQTPSIDDFVRVKMEVLLPPSSLQSIVAGENVHLIPAASPPPPSSVQEHTANSEASQSPPPTSSVGSKDNSTPRLPMASEDTTSSALASRDSAESLPPPQNIPPPPPPPPQPPTTTCNNAIPPQLVASKIARPPPPPSPPMATSEIATKLPPPPSANTISNVATPLPPPPPMVSVHAAATGAPPPPPIPGKPGPPPPPPAPGSSGSIPPPPPMISSNGSAPAPPPPMQPGKGGAPPPPPAFAGAGRLSARVTTKLKRSSQMGNLYRALKGKIEGSSVEGKSSQRKGSKVASSSGGNGKQGMADALAEMTKRSSYFLQIEEDVKNYANSIKEVKAALSSFQTTDMAELIKFHRYVESHLEKLSDETQVLARFEDFPIKKLEGLRMAAALYSKLDAMAVTLENWKIESPASQLLDKVENYFSKIKGDLDTLDRTKDDEIKKFKSQNIHFDFGILVRIKELLVDVSSNCMELALKETIEAKAKESEGKTDGKNAGSAKVLWKAFQFAYRVYTFAGGQDDRADRLTREVAQEIETVQQQY